MKISPYNARFHHPHAIRKGNWVLVRNDSNAVVMRKDKVPLHGPGHLNDVGIIEGGAPPHKPSSSGFVHVSVGAQTREFYPSVIDCKWVQVGEAA